VLFSYNLRFPGQYYLPETGISYNYFRDYDPQTGRYLESDPLGLAGGSYSTYAYVNGNPISRRDPLGLCAGDGGKEPTGEKKPDLPSCPIALPGQELKPKPGSNDCPAACWAAQQDKTKSCLQSCSGLVETGACAESWRTLLPECIAANCN
jgi:RHS repeat-associated protein